MNFLIYQIHVVIELGSNELNQPLMGSLREYRNNLILKVSFVIPKNFEVTRNFQELFQVKVRIIYRGT